MTREQYMAQRQNLMKQANTALAGGDAEAANGFADQVKELDNKWEAIATAEANLNALNDSAPTTLNVAAVANSLGAGVEPTDGVPLNQAVNTVPTYEHAWAKAMVGGTLNAAEQEVYDKANERFNDGAGFSHSTKTTPTLIPNTVVAGIWKIAEEQYPLFADAKKFNITGTLTINKHDGIVSGDAQWVDEDSEATDEENKFGQLILKGFELNKVATVSWKMKAMSEDDFIAFLTQELADRLGVALGKAVHTGNGTTEPKGVKTELLAEDGTPQVVEYDGQLTYQNVTALFALIHSSFAGKAAIYANSKTIWNQLANIVDGQGRPLFVANPAQGGVGTIMGYVVKPDAGAADGDVLASDPADTLVVNINQALSVAMEDHVKGRKTDYGAYAIADAGLLTTKGSALLTPKA